MPSASAVLSSVGGLARTATLLGAGVTERELNRAVRTGEILRVRKGVYATMGTAEVLRHAAEHGGVPGCTDAGRMHGLWILEDAPRQHVWLGRGGDRRRDCRRCRLHWDDGVVRVGELPPVENTLLQIALCADEETFFAAYESALRWARISPAGIAWLWKRLPVRMRWLMSIARSDADSGLESLVRLRLHRLGIRVRTQVTIRGVGEVDLVIGDRLIVECDGRENHEREAQRHKDLVRDAAAAALGYDTLRFDYAMIVHDWARVEAAILAKIARMDGGSASEASGSADRMPAQRRVAGRLAGTGTDCPRHPTPAPPLPRPAADSPETFSEATAGRRSARPSARGRPAAPRRPRP